jgi:hypothetical protein
VRPPRLLLLTLLALLAGAAAAAAKPVTIDGWGTVVADYSGRNLVIADFATATVKGRDFSYYRADTYRVRLSASGGVRGATESPVVVREQIGPMQGGTIVGNGSGGFVLLAAGRGFAAPVIWCCTSGGIQNTVESDGRKDAPQTVAAAQDGKRVRWIRGRAGRYQLLAVDAADESGETRTQVGFPGRPRLGLAALGPGNVAWVDQPLYSSRPTLRIGVPTDAGVRSVRSLPQPGPVLRIWVERGTALVANRVGAQVQLARYDLPSTRRVVVWRGSGLGPTSLGGGTVATTVGRRVLAAGAGALRPVRTATAPVAAVAVDGSRLAVFERLITKKGARITALRLARVR